jgi:hypothetical protein
MLKTICEIASRFLRLQMTENDADQPQFPEAANDASYLSSLRS